MKIEYHPDARGLAICVKVCRLDDGGINATESQREAAFYCAQEDWWADAEVIAQRHGFKEVYGCGRSGGWLHTAPMPDGYPDAFIADLSAHLANTSVYYQRALRAIVGKEENV